MLAQEVTRLVRGVQGLQMALKATNVMFGEEPVSVLPPSGTNEAHSLLLNPLVLLCMWHRVAGVAEGCPLDDAATVRGGRPSTHVHHGNRSVNNIQE